MKISITEYTIGVYYRMENSIACAETSKTSKDTYYFNRIIVPKQLRNKGIGTLLLKELLKVFKEKKLKLICEINPYGDLNYKQLEKWYVKNGFVLNKKENYLIYN